MKTEALIGPFAACLLYVSAVQTTQAQAPSAADIDLLDRLREAYPATQFDAVAPSVVPGLYEVQMGRNVAYVERNGRYFFFGHVYDLPNQKDLTAERKAALARVDFDALPFEDALTFDSAHDHPTRSVAVFSDPLCGHCKTLEHALAQVPDLRVHVFMLPLQTGSEGIAARVGCAQQPAQAWRALMTEGRAPERASSDCNSSMLDRNRALARRLGVVGTPTLVAQDGRIHAGALSGEALAQWLSSPAVISQSKSSSEDSQ